jgi:hypothetical protein
MTTATQTGYTCYRCGTFHSFTESPGEFGTCEGMTFACVFWSVKVDGTRRTLCWPCTQRYPDSAILGNGSLTIRCQY